MRSSGDLLDAVTTGDVPRRRRFFASLVFRAACMIGTCAIAGVVLAGRPPLIVPTSPTTVLERLPRGYAALMPSTTAVPPLQQIQSLLRTAARSGDARLAARAEALLAQLPDGTSADVMKARAFSAQHRHDFATALRLLDRVLARSPDDAEARLSRAQIQLVQGRLDLARSDCGALTLGMQADAAALCLVALTLRRGDLLQAAGLADRLIDEAVSDPDLLAYLLALRGEIAGRAGDAGMDRWFTKALAIAPDDVRTLAAYARALHARGRDRDVLALLSSAPATDGLALQRALAAHAAGTPDATILADAQGRRYALAHEVGTQPELRDEAEYLLTLRGDADGALALAQRNFMNQRDYEDVDILLRAATAASRTDVVASTKAWAASQGIRLRQARP